MMGRMHDWRQAVKRPIGYTVANQSMRSQHRFVSLVLAGGAVVLIALYMLAPSSSSRASQSTETGPLAAFHLDHYHHTNSGRLKLPDPHNIENKAGCSHSNTVYNATYPLSSIVIDGNVKRMKLAIISDLDQESKSKGKSDEWYSLLLRGELAYNTQDDTVSITWDDTPVKLKSGLSSGGRGMELSELIVFNGKLLTCDDRTGVIYEIVNSKPVPWIILGDGDGHHETKGFKCEWMAVKDQSLYVGGLGKEWTSPTGELLNHNPQFVKQISPAGAVEHIDWVAHYLALRSAAGISPPGYLIHESAAWSPVHRKWYFLPRRASQLAYNDVEDEKRATNLLLSSSDTFTDIAVSHTPDPLVPTHGFSSFKFLPTSGDTVIVSLKSEESDGRVASYVSAFSADGRRVLLAETPIPTPNVKYEGLEFV